MKNMSRDWKLIEILRVKYIQVVIVPGREMNFIAMVLS